MKKYGFLILTFVALFIFISGNIYSSTISKNEIAESLYSQFNIFMDKINNNQYSRYNAIMAADKAIGILGVYRHHFPYEKLSTIQNDLVELSMGDFSTVYSGYTKSGLHFIALAQPLLSNNDKYEDAVNKIKGYDKEMDLLAFAGLLTNDGNKYYGYYAIDLYIEDLTEQKEEIKLKVTTSSDELAEQSPLIKLNDKNLDQLLNKHNRTYETREVVKVDQWHLYLFKKEIGWPIIKVSTENETVELTKLY